MTASVRFVAYLPGDDDKLGFLPAPISWDVSVFHNNVSALTLKYSNLAAGGEYITRALQIGLDIGFEVNWDDGTGWHEPFDCRFVRIKNNKNDVNDPAKLVSLTCPGYGWMLSKIKNTVADNRKLKTKDTGDIVRLFWNEYAARHATKRIPIDIGSWTTGTDSAGAAWIKKKTLTFELAADLLTILQGQVDIDHCDYRFDKRSLKIWNPDSQWIDLSNTVKLRLGQEVGEAPADESLEEMIHYLLVRGEKKTKAILTNDAVTPWGIWEGCINEGGVDTNAEAASAAEKQMDLSSRMRGEYTVNLNLRPEDPLPFKDYRPGDWVEGPNMAGAPQKMRVQQITLSGEGSAVTGSVVLNDLVKASELALSSKLAAVSNGATQTGGTGTAPDEAADLRQPDAPTGFTVTPALYLTTAKRWAVRLLFEWNEVLTATDGTELAISGYRVWGAKAGETSSRVIATTPGADLSALMDGFEQGTAWTFSVQAIGGTTTEPGAQSTFVTMTLPTDTTAPVKTSAPALESTASIVTATWDGLSSTGGAMDADLGSVRVLAGAVNPPTATVGTLGASGTWTGYAEAGDTVYFAFRAVDTSGNVGPISNVVSIVVKSVLDDAELSHLLALNATVYVQDEEPVSPPPESWWWTKTADPTVLKYTADGITWEVIATDGSGLIAAPVVVAGALNAQWIRSDNIASDSILARHIKAHEITADLIATGLLSALVIAGQVIKTAESGKRVMIDRDGITLYDTNDIPITFINTNGESFFTGNVTATSLKVTGSMSLGSSENTMDPGSVLALNAGVQRPVSPPSATSYYSTVILRKADGTAFGAVDMAARDSAGYWYAAVGTVTYYNFPQTITKFNPDGTYNSTLTVPVAGLGDGTNCISDITCIGTTLFAMYARNTPGTSTAPIFSLYQFDSEMTTRYWISDVPVALSAMLNTKERFYSGDSMGKPLYAFAMRMDNDGVNLLLGYVAKSTGKETFIRADQVSGEFYPAKVNSAKWAGAGQHDLWAISGGNFDYGTKFYVSSIPGTGTVRHTRDSDQTNQTNWEYPTPAPTLAAMGWDGSYFWSLDSSGTVYMHSGITWTDTAAQTKNYDAGVAFYNSTPYESKLSPKTTFAVKKRARVKLSVSDWVVAAPITRLRFYLGVSGGTLYAQSTNAAGYANLRTILSSGSTPSLSSTFPSATPSKITNGAELVISADGTIRSKLMQSSMVKTTSGPAVTAGTLTQVTGFTAMDTDAPVTVDGALGKITVLENGFYDVDFYARWPNFGTAYTRMCIVSRGTAGTDAIAADAQGGANWCLQTASAKGVYLTDTTVLTFWVYCGTGTTLNPTSLAVSAPMTNVAIRRV